MRILSASDDTTLRIWDAGRASRWRNCGACRRYGAVVGRGMGGVASASEDGSVRVWDGETGVELLAFYSWAAPGNWASIDRVGNRVLACGPEAWRHLGWVRPEPGTGLPEWLPAESLGPLPVVERNRG